MKKILIVGMGASGKAVFGNAIGHGVLPIFYDDNFLGEVDLEKIIADINLIVVSPAISPTHIIFQLAKKFNIPIVGEIEYAYEMELNKRTIVGITGTNGKTTVSTMLHTILSKNFDLAGNIGLPASEILKSKRRGVILELSSFQLMTIQNFNPHIAVLLNLKPDHIDYHKNFKNYKKCKLNIVKNQTSKDFLILNADDRNLKNIKTSAKVLTFSKKDKSADCYFDGKKIIIQEAGLPVFTIEKSIFGEILEHNIQNIMAVMLVIKCLNLSYSFALNKLLTYNYQPFRMEFLGVVNFKTIYNDSKSTNVASTISALESLKTKKQICLILGGRYKNESFKTIFSKYKNIDLCLVFGESKFKIEAFAKELGFKNIKLLNTLEEVVEIALNSSCKIILFSPACASFDMFSGFLERGEKFNSLVFEYKK